MFLLCFLCVFVSNSKFTSLDFKIEIKTLNSFLHAVLVADASHCEITVADALFVLIELLLFDSFDLND